MTFEQWLAVASIALPLLLKALSDLQANAIANHNLRLARIVGMAKREAGTVLRTLNELPPGTDPKTAERALVANSTTDIMAQMSTSAMKISAASAAVGVIVQAEVNAAVNAQAAVAPMMATMTPVAAELLTVARVT